VETTDILIARWRAKNTARKSIDAELDALAELIMLELDDGEKRGGVQCIAQRRFSATLAKEMLTSADYDRICEQKPSAAKAERLLGTEIVDMCREPGPRFLRRADE
jgi:hypothetical protein